jgi:hypothetical protein
VIHVTTIHPEDDHRYWSRDYFLGHCEGFRVETPEGRIGFVERVLGDEDEPETLVVRGGLFGNRLEHVPVAAVVDVEPRAERIRVRAPELVA